jgi:hypothetical protein
VAFLILLPLFLQITALMGILFIPAVAVMVVERLEKLFLVAVLEALELVAQGLLTLEEVAVVAALRVTLELAVVVVKIAGAVTGWAVAVAVAVPPHLRRMAAEPVGVLEY